MQRWSILARTLASAAALAIATAAPAQDAPPIPRADGYAEIESLPDWVGVWAPGGGVGGFRGPPPAPKLAPAAQQQLDTFREKQRVEGVSQDAQIHCRPPGMPGIMRQPYPLEFIFSPKRVTIFAETYSQARRIYTDGRALPEDPEHYFNGNSVGRWEGDTLIVDTTNFLKEGAFRGATSNMHLVERFTRVNRETLRYDFTVDDPATWTKPWTASIPMVRTDEQIFEYACHEGNHGFEGVLKGARYLEQLPPSQK